MHAKRRRWCKLCWLGRYVGVRSAQIGGVHCDSRMNHAPPFPTDDILGRVLGGGKACGVVDRRLVQRVSFALVQLARRTVNVEFDGVWPELEKSGQETYVFQFIIIALASALEPVREWIRNHTRRDADTRKRLEWWFTVAEYEREQLLLLRDASGASCAQTVESLAYSSIYSFVFELSLAYVLALPPHFEQRAKARVAASAGTGAAAACAHASQ